ncbi:MAG: sugar phosphate isomerase/epimerase [Bacteroidota bacterium]|jgi:sugar phosphate isomerase/epimerase|nr:sugar phosphate isomerase/epimerase [Bacteroidota bacterium]
MEKKLSRRKFLNTATAASALALIPFNYGFKSFSDLAGLKSGADFGGVRVGAITYSWRSMPESPEDIIRYCKMAGLRNLELMSDVAEDYLGIPKSPARPPRGTTQTAEQKEAYQKEAADAIEAQRNWRLSLPMQKYVELRKIFNDAGINIHIVKFSPARWTDGEIDYAFNAARAMGAKGVTNEISDEACKRLAPFAEKHKMYAIFHQHMQPEDPNWNFDKFLAYSPNIMLNVDTGHYFGSTGKNPTEVLKRLHKRIFSIHLKDKTGPKATPPNTNEVWGKGGTPIADILLLLKKEKWPIYADIEFEYDVPEGSDAAKEVAKCAAYARKILS